jgi:ABC-type glycerol-3-phosphate transport system substrate-binding protein
MKPRLSLIGMLVALGALLSGCGGEETAKADPNAIEAAFKDAPAEAAAPATQESTTDSISISVGADGNVPVKALAARAAAAMRKDDVQEAMVMLQTLRRARNLSPDQLGAVQDQMAALQSELAGRAANGDARAKQAMEMIQQSTRW